MEDESAPANDVTTSSQHYLSTLKLASLWTVSILSLCCFITLLRNICLAIKPPAMLTRLKKYSNGPIQSTDRTKDGTIVPMVNYFEKEKAKAIMKKRGKRSKRRERQRERRRRKRERRMMNRNIQEEDYLDSMKLLEMQMTQLDDEDDDKIIQCKGEKTSKDLSMLYVKQLPDNLLSPVVTTFQARRMSLLCSSRRFSLEVSTIPYPSPLSPSYLPNRPVSVIWSSTHRTESLYRYTHIERVVYPPGYIPYL